VWSVPPPHEDNRLSWSDRRSLRRAGDNTQLEHNTFSAATFEDLGECAAFDFNQRRRAQGTGNSQNRRDPQDGAITVDKRFLYGLPGLDIVRFYRRKLGTLPIPGLVNPPNRRSVVIVALCQRGECHFLRKKRGNRRCQPTPGRADRT